ncbi:hypothetical protein [Nocardia sp. NPDC050435]|uniref:hypothetical protein n=1 Tax=Nocardia sp. NPDC050435 TaxID=3155040 RepID=UPI0034066D5F
MNYRIASALFVVGVGGIAGCVRVQPAPAFVETSCTAPRFVSPFTAVDPCSAEAVLVAALVAMFSYTPATESDQQAAFTAAAPLLTPDYAARGRSAATVILPITVATWQQWRTAAVAVDAEAHLTGDDHPVDTDTAIYRVMALTLRPSDASASLTFTAYVTAGRTDRATAWRLSGIEVLG